MRLLIALLVTLFAGPAFAQPLVIAHRGASGERPEHTRAAFELAIAQGADLIEPDLVMSRDGVLIVRHENEIGETTDVADRPEFAPRRTTRTIDGRSMTGWFAEDFTLAELKTLRARERLPQLRPGNTAWRDEAILTFDEVLAITREGSARTGRAIGVAPELKHPTYLAAAGLDPVPALLKALEANDRDARPLRIIVQCFEIGALQRLRQAGRRDLLQLVAATGGPADRPDVGHAQLITPEGLAAVALYADHLGADASLVLPRGVDGRAGPPTSLVADAHVAGLKVVVWTLRAEDIFLPLEHRAGGFGDWVRRFREAGVDALFTDQPGAAISALRDR